MLNIGSHVNRSKQAIAQVDLKRGHRSFSSVSYVAMHPNGVEYRIPQLDLVEASSIALRRGSLSPNKMQVKTPQDSSPNTRTVKGRRTITSVINKK